MLTIDYAHNRLRVWGLELVEVAIGDLMTWVEEVWKFVMDTGRSVSPDEIREGTGLGKDKVKMALTLVSDEDILVGMLFVPGVSGAQGKRAVPTLVALAIVRDEVGDEELGLRELWTRLSTHGVPRVALESLGLESHEVWSSVGKRTLYRRDPEWVLAERAVNGHP